MRKKFLLALLAASALAIAVLAPTNTDASIHTCSVENGCSDCKIQSNGYASCVTVSHPASCSCTISVSNPYLCKLQSACDYTGAGLGPLVPSSGGSCTILAGEWCPPGCASCTVVFWWN